MSLCCGALAPVCPRRLCQRHVRGLVAVVRNLIAIACPRMTSRRRVAMMWRTRASVSVTFITRHAVTTGPASRSRIGSGCSYSDSGVISAHDLMSARRHAVTHSRQRIRDVYIGVMHPASRSCFDSDCSCQSRVEVKKGCKTTQNSGECNHVEITTHHAILRRMRPL